MISKEQYLPSTREEAKYRACMGLKALNIFSCQLWEEICEECNYSQQDEYDYWLNIVADTESHFQGNLNMLLVHKRIYMKDGDQIVLLYERNDLDEDVEFSY
jgi:hypothetical protein